MTHNPYPPIVDLGMTAFMWLFMAGLPTLALAEALWQRNRMGKAIAALVVGTAMVSIPNAIWKSFRHSQLQQEAARRSGCTGYGQGAVMPEHCREALMSTGVIPDGMFFWTGIALALAFAGLAVVFGESVIEWINGAKFAV